MFQAPKAPFLLAGAALFSLLAAGPQASGEEAAEGAQAFAHRFLKAFARNDFETVSSLFAAGATVSGIWLAQKAPRPFHLSAEAWVSTVEKEHKQLQDVRIRILESSQHSFDEGTVVAQRFVQTGKAGGKAFTNNGVESYLLSPDGEGGWKILHYAYMEKFAFDP
ncbi:MAG: nuclear transport factor 2 family protein [Acidobacteriota bacterium]